ncbi:MAG: CAP domain-containing protein [Cyanobacteria bacterium P01_F01_bin.53]
MRWTPWWSVALIGALMTSCGAESRVELVLDEATNTASEHAQVTDEVAADCGELGLVFAELLSLTNKARQAAGLGSLSFAYQLGQSAQSHAADLGTQDYFSHVGKDGSELGDRLAETGYQFNQAGENIAAGQVSAMSTFQDWMNSEGHRANILNEEFTEVGFGVFNAAGSSEHGTYWVQNFGKPMSGHSPEGPYIPSSCGTSTASADDVYTTRVAGISIVNEMSSDTLMGAMPKALGLVWELWGSSVQH